MEGSESEKVYSKLNLKPQFFVNAALNTIDHLLVGAFDYFLQDASRVLSFDDASTSYEDLKSGIDVIRGKIQASLGKRLKLWEQYCLRKCFAVPSGFSLPSENEASGDSMDLDEDGDEQVDSQLDSLRSKLAEAMKECSELNRELRELESQSAFTKNCASAVNEALQLYDKSSAQVVFQEMLRVTSELRQKMDQLKAKQKEDTDRDRRERVDVASGGLCSMQSDSLQEFITEMNL
ncbi:hypothetical protein vseg_017241 [Gypsophila vaccaria]